MPSDKSIPSTFKSGVYPDTEENTFLEDAQRCIDHFEACASSKRNTDESARYSAKADTLGDFYTSSKGETRQGCTKSMVRRAFPYRSRQDHPTMTKDEREAFKNSIYDHFKSMGGDHVNFPPVLEEIAEECNNLIHPDGDSSYIHLEGHDKWFSQNIGENFLDWLCSHEDEQLEPISKDYWRNLRIASRKEVIAPCKGNQAAEWPSISSALDTVSNIVKHIFTGEE